MFMPTIRVSRRAEYLCVDSNTLVNDLSLVSNKVTTLSFWGTVTSSHVLSLKKCQVVLVFMFCFLRLRVFLYMYTHMRRGLVWRPNLGGPQDSLPLSPLPW